MATTAYRYGGTEAQLSIKAIASKTRLSDRTVQSALTSLIRQGVISREGRCCRLRIHLDAIVRGPGSACTSALPGTEKVTAGSANTFARRKRKQACASPTSLYSLDLKEGNASCFSPKQLKLIADVMADATDLLGIDASQLSVLDDHLTRLGMHPPVSYAEAFARVTSSGERRKARDYVRAVLHLKTDERVQGQELAL